MNRSINHIPSLNYGTMKHFGLAETGYFDSKKSESVRNELEHNIRHGKITLLIGRYESGKTMLVRQLKRELHGKVNFVDVQTFHDRRIPMGTILSSIIEDLSTENIRRDMRARSKQAVRILGNKLVNEQKPTCVIIDNTPDRLHLNTMNALKLLMEADFAGYSPLVSFIILGWPEFTDRMSKRDDIMHRVQTIKLDQAHGWYTLPDRVGYLEAVFGDVITPAARERIARMHALPGDLNAYVVNLMQKAQRAGYAVLDDEIVQPSLAERYNTMKEQYGDRISYSLIGKQAGVAKSTVSLAIEKEPPTDSTSKVRRAMDVIEGQLSTPKSPKGDLEPTPGPSLEGREPERKIA